MTFFLRKLSYSVFDGRVRRKENDVAVSHYETIKKASKVNFAYITNMNVTEEVRLHFKCDDTSPYPYMKVYGKFTG